jgi:hypothetical protein
MGPKCPGNATIPVCMYACMHALAVSGPVMGGRATHGSGTPVPSTARVAGAARGVVGVRQSSALGSSVVGGVPLATSVGAAPAIAVPGLGSAWQQQLAAQLTTLVRRRFVYRR